MKLRNMGGLIVLVVGLFVGVAGSAQVAIPSVPVDLGTLGGTFSGASAVNIRGQVVGYSGIAAGETHAFLWTRKSGMTDLGNLGSIYSQAYAANARQIQTFFSADVKKRHVLFREYLRGR